MPCLTVHRVYDYLDGALPAEESAAVERHLEECPACRHALDARKRLAEAADCLPPFSVPDDFAACVMSKLPAAPVKKPRLRLVWASAAAATLVSGLGLGVILSGQGVIVTLQKIGTAFGSYLQGALNFAAKGLKLLTLVGKIIETVSSQVLATLRSAADMIGPEGQAVLAGGALVIVITGGMLLRRRQILSERTHDK
jgi:predicted anti-sigma-YlaC factor YlaD